MSFASASRFARIEPGLHRGDIDAEWAQGRGAYGGLVAAILARAIEGEVEGQALVSATVAFCAPASAGEASARVEVVRAGRNVSTVRASMERDGQVIATALATTARRREGGIAYDDLARPDAPQPDEVADGPAEHYIPAFARFFEFRQCFGPRPFSGAREARVGGWCRLREGGAIDHALVCALLDAWPPAAAALAPAWCPVASIELRVDFLAGGAIAGDWMLYDARAHHVGGGIADETAVLWSRDGRAIATSRQRIAIFPAVP